MGLTTLHLAPGELGRDSDDQSQRLPVDGNYRRRPDGDRASTAPPIRRGRASTRTWAICPQGYDGVDNDGNGLIDDSAEGVNPQQQLGRRSRPTCRAHKHITARAEMLYAILVEGQGPLGSVFNRDDFTDKEVQDTDGDGLPEFVDAWGQPLQFFRWPLLYHSDIQRGQVIVDDPDDRASPDLGRLPTPRVFDQREQDPLDPNQQLVAPGWWSEDGMQHAATPSGLQFLERRQQRERQLRRPGVRVLLPPADRAVRRTAA